jgi:hypothetical protein
LQKIKDTITDIDKIMHVSYFEFLERIFVKEEEMAWSEVIRLLCPKRKVYIRPSNQPLLQIIENNFNTKKLKKIVD